MHKQKGFSLIELLIVVAIILIIAAIAIPSLVRAKIAANESSAAASVRTIISSEIAYSTTFPDIGYPSALVSLGARVPGCVPSSTMACILDGDLSNGNRSGYQFSAAASSPAGGPNTSYFIVGWPQNPNASGVKGFCGTEDNTVRVQNPYASIADGTACMALPTIGN